MSREESISTKELSFLYRGVKYFVDVTEETTIDDVRKLIPEQLDEGLFPPEFEFWVDDTLMTKKQEVVKKACRYITRKLSIQSIRASMKDETIKLPPTKYQKTSEETKSPKAYQNEDKDAKKSESTFDTHSKSSVNESSDSPLNQPEKSHQNMAKERNDFFEFAEGFFNSDNESMDDDCDTVSDTDDMSECNSDNDEKQTAFSKSHGNSIDNDTNKKAKDCGPSKTCIHNYDYTFENDLKVCQDTLKSIDLLLQSNPLFCNNDRREEWRGEITRLLSKSPPKTIFGVLGNTGVGKVCFYFIYSYLYFAMHLFHAKLLYQLCMQSSLLNALLDEASVLPTSGSRGCTATVVELRYNIDLLAVEGHEVSVYKGDIEFMSHNEWMTELRILVDECCTQEKRVYQRQPDPKDFPEAAAAWTKIDEVYGKGAMISHEGKSSTRVYKELSNNRRLFQLLSPTDGSAHPYNIISVQEGKVISASNTAEYLLGSYQNMNTRMKRSKKDWAEKFGAKINSYVYGKGNGGDVQTWPLIRKVVLYGPWACLSTGASLVDLPGVRDANAARAKVAENYLQNCNQIWIVAPIKRAVDDGSAKEMLGEQFKRRLLMDGQYGNVSFICTQTDDCETTEIMRDHVDVAQNVEGRWEKMVELVGKIRELEKCIEDREADRDKLKKKISKMEKKVDRYLMKPRKRKVVRAPESYMQKIKELKERQDENVDHIKSKQHECKSFQIKLKTLCAIVRNEYSTKCLQEDFKEGLKALSVTNVEEDDFDANHDNKAIPDDFTMPVHCISSNDYLKMQGIKSSSDGLPATFLKAMDTQIPSLQKFVKEVSTGFRKEFVKVYVNDTSNFVETVKLLASGETAIRCSVLKKDCKLAFEKEFEENADLFLTKREVLSQNIKEEVRVYLQPSLAKGSKKGAAMAMSICESWGSSSKRARNSQNPGHHGLYYQTYNATMRRNGVYTSESAGAIDLNQELFDPMEKEISIDWQRVMGKALPRHLTACETKIKKKCERINEKVSSVLEKFVEGNIKIMDIYRTAADRICSSFISNKFTEIFEVLTDKQRGLNRSPLPAVQSHMVESYDKALEVERGNGAFQRMKDAMSKTTSPKVLVMFDKPKAILIEGIDILIKDLLDLISKLSEGIIKHLRGVYSILWDDMTEVSNKPVSETRQKVRICRNDVLPKLTELQETMSNIQQKLYLNRNLDTKAVDGTPKKHHIQEVKMTSETMDRSKMLDKVAINVVPEVKALNGSTHKKIIETKTSGETTDWSKERDKLGMNIDHDVNALGYVMIKRMSETNTSNEARDCSKCRNNLVRKVTVDETIQDTTKFIITKTNTYDEGRDYSKNKVVDDTNLKKKVETMKSDASTDYSKDRENKEMNVELDVIIGDGTTHKKESKIGACQDKIVMKPDQEVTAYESILDTTPKKITETEVSKEASNRSKTQDKIGMNVDFEVLSIDSSDEVIDLSNSQNELGMNADLEVMTVESLNGSLRKKIKKAKASGDVIDLCDSDEEFEIIPSKLPPRKSKRKSSVKIKKESGVLKLDQ